MGSLREQDVKTARRKGLAAAAVTGGAVVLMVAGAPLLGAVALVPAAVLGWRWFTFRAQRGMRF